MPKQKRDNDDGKEASGGTSERVGAGALYNNSFAS